jgi:molybdopterin molybdotransferase
MLAPDAAWEMLLPALAPLPATVVPAAQALGRVLAHDLVATVDVPFADVSAMDGYAVAGTLAPGTVLAVAGTIAAGAAPGARLPAGDALRIMTGAPLPAEADRVVPIEQTDGGADEMTLHTPVAAGAHVRRRGEVQRAGSTLLAAGEALGAGALGLLATHGLLAAAVHRAPRVGFLVTGDEVVPADREPGPGQLRDSHGPFLAAAIAACGGEAVPLGIALDRRERIVATLANGLASRLDLLLVTGGVSQGAFDFVEEALGDLGFTSLFHGVAVQPGGPLLAAAPAHGSGLPTRLAFGLPGNPASVMTAFWLFVAPALRRLQGHDDGHWRGAVRGRLAAPLPAGGARHRFLPAHLAPAGDAIAVTPLLPRGSHDLGAYARGSGLVRVPAGAPAAAAGDACQVLPLLVHWG